MAKPSNSPPKTNADRQREYRARNGVTPKARYVTLKAERAVERQAEWRAPFLMAYRNSGIIRASCQAAGVSRNTVAALVASDPEFAREYREAEQDALDLIHGALRSRALTQDTTAAIYLMKIKGGEEWRQDRAAPVVTVGIDARTLIVSEQKL